MGKKRKVESGVYLVIDPSLEEDILLQKLQLVLQEKIAAAQLWDNFLPHKDHLPLIQKITALCHEKNVPVLINNQWEWLQTTALDGVHFDAPPEDLEQIKTSLNRDFITGLTCNNDLALVRWANDQRLDYISFCSIFPSSTSTSCELVDFETIKEAKRITAMPIFLAGGIKPDNMPELQELPFDGVAVVSGIMSAEKPGVAITKYLKQLKPI